MTSEPPSGSTSLPHTIRLTDNHLDGLAEAIYTLAAVHITVHKHLLPDQAARRVAEQRREVRHALANWQPPRDSYRAVELSQTQAH
jgi:hypothetical protein